MTTEGGGVGVMVVVVCVCVEGGASAAERLRRGVHRATQRSERVGAWQQNWWAVGTAAGSRRAGGVCQLVPALPVLGISSSMGRGASALLQLGRSARRLTTRGSNSRLTERPQPSSGGTHQMELVVESSV